jgi:ParB-like chromosome segregation protein Spo0J
MDWYSQEVALADLKPYPNNPRTIATKPFQDLKDSLTKFGVADPLVVNTDYMVIGGHARLLALRDLGWSNVQCFLPSRELTAKECEELNIRLNKNEAGQWDFGKLVNGFDFSDLLAWGFERSELGLNLGDLKVDGKALDASIAEGIELDAIFKLTVQQRVCSNSNKSST